LDKASVHRLVEVLPHSVIAFKSGSVDLMDHRTGYMKNPNAKVKLNLLINKSSLVRE
jgi:hypothetical protein